MQKRKCITLLFSVGLSAFLIWFLVSRIEAQDILQTFAHIHYPALFAFLTLSLINSALRAWRYKWLLRPYPISTGNILLVTFIRNLFVDLFPARIGSLSYIYILNKRLNFSFEVATSTFVVAFIFDFLTLGPFVIFSILAVGLGSTSISSSSFLAISFLFLLAVLIVLWKIKQISYLFLGVLQFFLKQFRQKGKKWMKTSTEKIRLTINNLDQIKHKKIYWPIFFLSLCIRLAKYSSLYFLLFSLLRGHGFSYKNLSFWKTILGITGAELTEALPIKGIGGFGTWESGWALTFKLLSFEPRIAILSGIGVHVITNLFEYMLGIASILILTLPYIRKGKAESVSPPASQSSLPKFLA